MILQSVNQDHFGRENQDWAALAEKKRGILVVIVIVVVERMRVICDDEQKKSKKRVILWLICANGRISMFFYTQPGQNEMNDVDRKIQINENGVNIHF